MEVSKEEYVAHFLGFHVTDCVVRDRNILYWVLLEGYDESRSAPPDFERNTRIVARYLDEENPDDFWGTAQMKGMNRLHAGTSLKPQERFVGIDGIGQVYVIGGGESRLEKRLPVARDGGILRGAVTRLKNIDGYLYVCTTGRGLFRRDGTERWRLIGDNPPYPTRREQADDLSGFHDFDAFSSDDIFCAGDSGDVWHWNGTSWRRIDFPSNMRLWSVCCGGDSYTYIGAESGNVWRGRSDRWELFHEDNLTLPFKDMAWFADTLWATSDYGLWQLQDGKMVKADVPIAISNCSGNLSVNDGVMLLSGEYGAALHDGNEWTLLFDLATLRAKYAGTPKA